MKKIIWHVVLLILVGSAAVRADTIAISIDNSPQSGPAGSTVTFDATMTNPTGGLLNLNGDNFSLTAPFTTADVNDSAFFIDWPSDLAAGASFGSTALFSITIPNGAAPGIYDGTFQLLGGPGLDDQNLLGSASFEIDVSKPFTAIPEPGTFSLMLLGLMGLSAMGMKQLRA
jgi:hypothetical protein